MIILVAAEKGFDGIQQPFKIKTPSQLGIEGNFLTLLLGAYRKPTVNIFSLIKDSAFSPKSGIKQRCLILPFPFSILPEVLDSKARKENVYTWEG